MSNFNFSEVILLVRKPKTRTKPLLGKPRMTFHCIKALLGYLNFEKCSSRSNECLYRIRILLDPSLLDGLKPEAAKRMIHRLAPNAEIKFLATEAATPSKAPSDSGK